MQRKRDDFSKSTKEVLAKRVGYRCSNPICRCITIGANSNPNKSTNIGVAAHISAAAQGGPRYNSKLSTEERTSLNNAIWLCQTCSVLIDKDPDMYSTELLRDWKVQAESASMNEINNPRKVENYNYDELSDDGIDPWIEDFEAEFEKLEQESSVYVDIISLLAACRRTMSWDNRSELKLYSWLEEHSENEISELDINELIVIRKNIIEYLQIHLDMDSDLLNVPLVEYINPCYLLEYIEIHPALTTKEIADSNRINLDSLKSVINRMWEEQKIIPVSKKDDPIKNYENCRWIKNYDNIE